MTDKIFASLHHACAAHGTRLFTVAIQDEAKGLAWRAYTSHPVEYPVSGTKPLHKDGWYDHTILRQRTFVANTPEEFALYFFDHALISSLGLGSCINVPVVHDSHVLGTVNLLAEAGHFTPARVSGYQRLVTEAHAPLVLAMRGG